MDYPAPRTGVNSKEKYSFRQQWNFFIQFLNFVLCLVKRIIYIILSILDISTAIFCPWFLSIAGEIM